MRSRPGVIDAFHAAYGTQDDSELVAAYDRMSVNLPVYSGNPAALRVAAATSDRTRGARCFLGSGSLPKRSRRCRD
jgi:hypothetical protein